MRKVHPAGERKFIRKKLCFLWPRFWVLTYGGLVIITSADPAASRRCSTRKSSWMICARMPASWSLLFAESAAPASISYPMRSRSPWYPAEFAARAMEISNSASPHAGSIMVSEGLSVGA